MIQIGNKEVASITIGGKEVQTITIGGKVAYENGPAPVDPTDYFYIENEYNGSNTITITNQMYDPSLDDPEATQLDLTKCGTNLEYSKDKSTWNTLTITAGGSNTIAMNTGEKVYFRNDTGKFNYYEIDYGGEWRNVFTTSNNSSVGGNIHTLIDYTGTNISTREIGCLRGLFTLAANITDASNLTIPSTTPVDYEYELLFVESGLLTPPSTLPATTLAEHCYGSMFSSCYSLTSVPTLPATTLAPGCYSQMFLNCSSLTSVSQNLLPATNLIGYDGCYESMFQACYNLTTTPSLPATTLAPGCYLNMFRETSVTTLPSLPVINLVDCDYCYSGMFADCTSLTTIPSNYLPATSLGFGCYNGMFSNCSSLTTIPANLLPVTVLEGECYSSMFSGCSSLTTIPSNLLPATTLTQSCYYNMFADCSSLTSVPYNLLPATTLSYNCYFGMFQGCSSLTTAPDLPATDITDCPYCYALMFYECTSLTSAPILYPQTLVDNCYESMFKSCSSLSSVTSYATDITATYSTFEWLDGVAETGTLYTNTPSIYTQDDTSGIPEGWVTNRIEPS